MGEKRGARASESAAAVPAPDDPGGSPPTAGERSGPLEVRCMRKDDGRSLIVFARVEEGEDG